MADSIYARDRIRRNTFPDICESNGIIGWIGVAASCDARPVVGAF